MKARKKHLKKCVQRRDLVSIRRDRIDSHSLQGFVLGYSDDFVCLHYIKDFCADGLLLIRRKDITKLRITGTDRTQKDMLQRDGVIESLDFSHCPPLESLREFFQSLADEEIVVIEDEAADPPLFFIGRILSEEESLVAGQLFTGTGRWDETPWEIDYEEITCCQLSSNYIKAYARHFARQSAGDA